VSLSHASQRAYHAKHRELEREVGSPDPELGYDEQRFRQIIKDYLQASGNRAAAGIVLRSILEEELR
jgi:hypothetical protein